MIRLKYSLDKDLSMGGFMRSNSYPPSYVKKELRVVSGFIVKDYSVNYSQAAAESTVKPSVKGKIFPQKLNFSPSIVLTNLISSL